MLDQWKARVEKNAVLSKSEKFTNCQMSKCQIFTNWISDLPFHWWISEKIFFTVKSVNFHWNNQWKKYFSLSNQSIFTEIIVEFDWFTVTSF